MEQNIEKLLVKFFMNAADINDLETLTNWLKKEEHKQIFKSYIKTNYAMDINMNEFDTENAKKEFLNKIRQDKKVLHKFKVFKVLKYAAAAVIVFGLGYFFQQGNTINSVDNTPIIVNNKIESGTDKATLTLESGEEVTLVKGASFQTQNATSNGEEIVYNKAASKDIAYNYITIPRGGQFQITLADGTQVWLNSESQLKYPIAFIEGETRQVELVYGEAYFDVSSSSNHKGADFKVYNQDQEIQVLGTEFNIKAYKGERNIYTTLVEGKVAINAGGQNKTLSPGEQSNLNILNNTISIANVNIRQAISWRDGIYIFKRESLKEIMTTLSRWYDMEVIFEDKNLEDIPFIGSLNKNQSIIHILDDIKNFGVIKNYEINNKTIILK